MADEITPPTPPAPPPSNLVPVNIEDEMRRSYVDYAMSVIIGRALPDARDGLSPVPRRILVGMRDMGLASNRAYRKCAKIVGEVMGNYHPHGDGPIYDALVRMAQEFSYRYPMVDGQGNFGSVDGDPPAAMRYTEARMAPFAEALLEDIGDIRDESDRHGMRVVIELKRGEQGLVVLNNLYKLTPMQTTFGVINLAIVNGQPKVLSLIELLRSFIEHRVDVVRRRTQYELRQAEARAHILEGLKKALDHIDAIIKLIRAAKATADAREGLIRQFEFTEIQAKAILEMQLQRLTSLERQKIEDELKELREKIAELKEILASDVKLREVIVKELRDVQKKYGDSRRTEIIEEEAEIRLEDLIAEEEAVITVSHSGYVKRTPASVYRIQGRGGKGRIGMKTKDEDPVTTVFVANTHSYVLVFTDRGRLYWLKVYEIPDVGSAGRGKAIVNLANLSAEEKVRALLSVKDFDPKVSVLMATRSGTVKKTSLDAFSNPTARGIIAMGVPEDDELIAAELISGTETVFIGTYDGMCIRFPHEEVREMGRQAYGVIGIRLDDADYVVSMIASTNENDTILSVTERGFGKRTAV